MLPRILEAFLRLALSAFSLAVHVINLFLWEVGRQIWDCEEGKRKSCTPRQFSYDDIERL